jgi:CRISPR system Cascade subunit CasA
MSEKGFNLLDEPWLPVRFADGRMEDLGLLETFRRSAEIVALAETAPPSLVAEYRLLLAITHRALVMALGAWKIKDRARWFREGLPVEDICKYLEAWREHFWLFHPERPFMQVAALATCSETSQTYSPCTVSLEQFYGVAMFNQEIYHDLAWSPSAVLRSLVGYLQFVPGGFFPGKKLKSSERAGALVNTAAVLPMGATLAQTLSLCLHPAPTGHETVPDLPAWEKPLPAITDLRGDARLATGANDRYTRQSRAVLLLRETEGNVRKLRFAAGLALDEDPNAPDPMASFRAGTNGLVRLTFREGRALWRDLPTLVPNHANGQVAAVVVYAVNLRSEISFETVYQPVLVAGLASDRAKLLRWRCEQIILPAALLVDADKAQNLCEQVAQAEELFGALRTLATGMLADTLPDPAAKDTRNRARTILDAGPMATAYFSVAERTLPQLMQWIAEGQTETAAAHWRVALRVAAQTAWNQVVTTLGLSPRTLRADAKYWPRFSSLLKREVPKAEEALNKPLFPKNKSNKINGLRR